MLDRSGSMMGHNITIAKEAARLFLLSLPSDSYFNIMSFGSSYKSLFGQSVKYSNESMKSAMHSLSQFDADMGGT